MATPWTRSCRLIVSTGLLLALTACGHPAENALRGKWLGERVENFDFADVAAATAWARGTSFEFRGQRLTVAVPAEEPRTGTYRLAAIQDRTVRLSVLGTNGEANDLELIVDDETSLRWVLGDGKTMVMRRER